MLPILYQNNNLILYSYPLLMGLGWGVAYQVFFVKSDLSAKFSHLLFWGLFLSSWIGAKLLFFVTTSSLPSSSLANFSFWTGGGFVFYGGFLLCLLYLLIYKFFRFPLSAHTVWSLLPALTLGHAVGRIGCLLAGCCFGEPTDWWWGIHMHGEDRHPTQALESIGLLALSFFLLRSKVSTKAFAFYFIGYGLIRFLIEILRGDDIRGSWGVLSPSQWISIVLIATGLLIVLRPGQRKPA